MEWSKKGLIWSHPLMDGRKTFAMAPTPFLIDDELIRVFYTSLDLDGRGLPFYVDVDAGNPTKIISFSEKPLMDLGDIGCFDDNGVMITSVVRDHQQRLLAYYAGFEICKNIRYRIFTGLAISLDNGKTFSRYSKVPLLDRVDGELYFRGGPFCLYDNGVYKLWYVAGSKWMKSKSNTDMPIYEIKHMESFDGINWDSPSKLVLPIEQIDEHGFGRPWVLKCGEDNYQLYYSIRRISLESYRLGFARSSNSIDWIRNDWDLNLEIGLNGVDENAIMYAAPITINGKIYCFYNGDNFGEMGIALAELVG